MKFTMSQENLNNGDTLCYNIQCMCVFVLNCRFRNTRNRTSTLLIPYHRQFIFTDKEKWQMPDT